MQDSSTLSKYTEQVIQQAINALAAQNKTVTNFFNKYDDAVYMNEIAPGKNRAIYLLGHLIAVNDGMQQLFMLGESFSHNMMQYLLRSPIKRLLICHQSKH